MKYTRIVHNTAIDTRDTSPQDCFTQNIVAEFVEVSDNVMDGWILTKGKWSAPPPPDPAIKAAQLAAEEVARVIALETAKLAEADNHNASILVQLAAADGKIIRALSEGDTVRIAAHRASQTTLRAQIH